MKVGLSISSSLDADDPAVAARWMIERARTADEAELDSLSVGDHHAMASPYYQNTPMLGRLLAEWGPRPAGCLFLLPLWHPVLVAEHIGTLAALVDAPFIVQTGIGYGDQQFAAMRADPRSRGNVLEESVRVIKALLAGDDVESPLVGAPVTLGLRPARPVDWWIGGGPSPRAIDRAARIGDAWYGSPALDAAAAQEQLGAYVEACSRHGADSRAIIRKDAIVLADEGAAAALGARLLEAGYRGLDRSQVLLGTPDEVATQLGPFAELGFDEVVCRCMSVPQPEALETIALLGEVRRLLR